MGSSQHTKHFVAAWVVTVLLVSASFSRIAYAQHSAPSSETTSVTIVVKEADTGEPISQAHLTLQFSEPGSAARFKKPHKIAYNAKTNAQGRYKFGEINKGAIVIMVTATGHQSYGKELQLDKDNPVFEVKLKKPQPLL